jgi:hypothetical protein
VTRYEFLKMALFSTCIALNQNTIDVPVRFSDVISIPQLDETADQTLKRQVIYTAVAYGIVQGYDDGTFKPDQPVNRAEALKILTLAAQLQLPPGSETGIILAFPDVKKATGSQPHSKRRCTTRLFRGIRTAPSVPGTPSPAPNPQRSSGKPCSSIRTSTGMCCPLSSPQDSKISWNPVSPGQLSESWIKKTARRRFS